MRIQRALSVGVLLFVGCAKASTTPSKDAARRPLTGEQEAFRRFLGHGCTGFKECDDLYIKTRRRAAECPETASDCSREREDLVTATKLRDDGFDRASVEASRQQFVLQGEQFRRSLAFGCPESDDCGMLVARAKNRVDECTELKLDCTRDRENVITATALNDAETKCRANPACIDPRLAKEVCEAKAETPPDDEEIAELLARFAAVARKPFNDKLCGKTKGR